MQVETVSNWSKRVTIEFSQDVVKQKMDEVYKEFGKKAEVPGFRKGKVPRDVLELHFKKDVIEKVKESLIRQGFEVAIKEKNIEPIANPLVEMVEFSEDAPFKAVLSIQIKPDIDVKDYHFLVATVEHINISEEEVDNELKMLQKRMAVLKPVESSRPVENGDYVLLDIIETIEGGEPVEYNNKLFKVGAGAVLEKLDSELLGMKEGETKSIDITFPEDLPDKKIAGKNCNYKIKLKGLRLEVLPEINDNFASSLGNYKNIEELKNAITERLKQIKSVEQDNLIRRQILEQLVERNKFDIPPALIESEMEILVQDLLERGISPEQFNQELKESIFKEAEFRAKGKLIIEKIAKKEGISASDEEVVQMLKVVARAQSKNFEELEHLLENPRAAEAIRFGIIEDKTLKFLKEKTRIEEKSALLFTPSSERKG